VKTYQEQEEERNYPKIKSQNVRCAQLSPTPSQTFLKTKSPFLPEARKQTYIFFLISPEKNHWPPLSHLPFQLPSQLLRTISHHPAAVSATGSNHLSQISKCLLLAPPHKKMSHVGQRSSTALFDPFRALACSFGSNNLFCTHMCKQEAFMLTSGIATSPLDPDVPVKQQMAFPRPIHWWHKLFVLLKQYFSSFLTCPLC